MTNKIVRFNNHKGTTAKYIILQLLCIIIPSESVLANKDLTSELNAIKIVFDENRNNFPHANFKFSYIIFSRTSIDQSEHAQFNDMLTADASFDYNDREAKYSRQFSASTLKATVKTIDSNQSSARAFNLRLLSNRRSTLEDLQVPIDKDNLAGSVEITEGFSAFTRMIEFPLDLGFSEEQRGDLSVEFDHAINMRGGAQIISIDQQSSGFLKVVLKQEDFTKTYFVDLEKGAIPRRVEFRRTDYTPTIVLLDDLRLIHGKGWLPFSMTTIVGNGGKHLHIKSVDFTQKGHENFRLKFSAPVSVVDNIKRVGYAKHTIWDLDNLPPLSSARSKFKEDSEQHADPVLPKEIDSTLTLRNLFAILSSIVVVAIIGSLVYWKLIKAKVKS